LGIEITYGRSAQCLGADLLTVAHVPVSAAAVVAAFVVVAVVVPASAAIIYCCSVHEQSAAC